VSKSALPLGLQVLECQEPLPPDDGDLAPVAESPAVGPWDLWPWTLQRAGASSNARIREETPQLVVWHFQPAA
jgi:hypothetical protein